MSATWNKQGIEIFFINLILRFFLGGGRYLFPHNGITSNSYVLVTTLIAKNTVLYAISKSLLRKFRVLAHCFSMAIVTVTSNNINNGCLLGHL